MDAASRLTHDFLYNCRRNHWTLTTMRWSHHRRLTARQVRRKKMKITFRDLMERNK